MCTRWASDWVVHRPDWLGLPMFSRVPSVCGLGPTSGTVFPQVRGPLGPWTVHKRILNAPSGAILRWWPFPGPGRNTFPEVYWAVPGFRFEGVVDTQGVWSGRAAFVPR